MTETSRPALPPPILSDDPETYAYGVFTRRNPVLVDNVAEARAYDAHRLDALARLKSSLAGDMPPLPQDAHDAALWAEWGRGYAGGTWLAAPFLWAESFFYRWLLEATGYFRAGPWHGVDPYAPMKDAELDSDLLAEALSTLDELAALDADEATARLLQAAMWGNRADLAVAPEIGTHGGTGALVADDTAAAVKLLQPRAGLRVTVIADNAGRELCADLVLIDHLLATGSAASVALHVKPSPYYISDATAEDLAACLRRLARDPGPAREAAERLTDARRDGRLTVASPAYYTAPWDYRHLRGEVAAALSTCDLAVAKGDLNYRRLVGDLWWPPTTPYAEPTAYFPVPVLALRTLKSEVLCGVAADVVAELDAVGRAWRTDGSHGLIQLRA